MAEHAEAYYSEHGVTMPADRESPVWWAMYSDWCDWAFCDMHMPHHLSFEARNGPGPWAKWMKIYD